MVGPVLAVGRTQIRSDPIPGVSVDTSGAYRVGITATRSESDLGSVGFRSRQNLARVELLKARSGRSLAFPKPGKTSVERVMRWDYPTWWDVTGYL